MWHLRSNYKRSFLWLLVSPRKSLQAHLLKLNLFLEPPITWKNQQFTPPGLPANFLFFGLTYAMPQVFRCAIVGGVLRYCRCNRDGCYFGCWLIRFQRSFLLLTFYKPLQLVVFFFFRMTILHAESKGNFWCFQVWLSWLAMIYDPLQSKVWRGSGRKDSLGRIT